MKDKYDPLKPQSFIMYFDCNNQYGYRQNFFPRLRNIESIFFYSNSMSCPLPWRNFKLINNQEIEDEKKLQIWDKFIREIGDEEEKGYIFEVGALILIYDYIF